MNDKLRRSFLKRRQFEHFFSEGHPSFKRFRSAWNDTTIVIFGQNNLYKIYIQLIMFLNINTDYDGLAMTLK